MDIKKVDISKVIMNPNNPRVIRDDKFKKLVKSIQDFPEMLDIRPIVVDENDIVLGGNMRLKACQSAGLKEVPIIKVSQLTEEQKKEFIVKTIVTTDLLADIAKNFGVESFEVLTGFKYIAEKIRELEGVKTFIAGGEESYGYLVGDSIRDKDAVVSCAMFAEITAWAKENGKSLYQILLEIYSEFGLYKEFLKSLTMFSFSLIENCRVIFRSFRFPTILYPPVRRHGTTAALY